MHGSTCLYLQILKRSGEPKQKQCAERIVPVSAHVSVK